MERVLNILKAVSDRNRLRVVMALTDHEELCVCEITEMLGLATATVSRHMSIMQRAGLVKSQKKGRWVYYSVSEAFPVLLMEWLLKKVGNDSEVLRDRKSLIRILGRDKAESCKTKGRGRESV